MPVYKLKIDGIDPPRVVKAESAAQAARDALLHLAVPRDAVPHDDFCDVGAVEYTAELA